eukprot:c3329_g1_i1.p1 GENE.c3329_g1_i1~~c3329_g1_i1.p1  ORF type:complete len:286 (-),score=83.75 c3329_g1_i1:37-894(-)
MRRGVLLLCLVVLVASQLHIPRNVDGHHYGLHGSQVQMDVFIDWLCDDCAYSWSQIRQLFDHYPPGYLEFSIHHLPLPFHRNAFDASVIVEVVARESPERLWEFLDFLFANQRLFSNKATESMTESQVHLLFAKLAQKFDIPENIVLEAFQEKSAAFKAARNGYKYSLQRGGIGGTPTFSINGVIVDAQNIQKWTAVQWAAYLDQFFAVEAQPAVASNSQQNLEKTVPPQDNSKSNDSINHNNNNSNSNNNNIGAPEPAIVAQIPTGDFHLSLKPKPSAVALMNS